MLPSAESKIPQPTAEQRRVAAERFERANQVISTGDYDYGIQLLLTCCKLDPANLVYRQQLRRTQKAKFKNNMRGSRFAMISTSGYKARIKAAKRTHDYLKALEHGEEVLARNPWDLGAQMDMAEAAEALGLTDLAVWLLEQARQRDGQDPALNRKLAQLYEKRGNFAQAIALWDLVHKAIPSDAEAHNKTKDLAANETIARGQYEQGAKVKKEPETENSLAKEDWTDVAPVNDRVARESAPLLSKIASSPTDPLPYLQLAAVYTRAGRYDEARDVLRNGLGPTGQHFQLRIELMELDLEPFRRNLAITEEKIKGLPPTPDPQIDPESYEEEQELRRIRLRLLKEINTRELELFRLKADRFPTEMNHRVELGLRLLRANLVDEAITELQQARKDPRTLWRALMYLGFSFKTRNNWRLAQRNFQEALAHIPSNEEGQRKEVLFQLAQGSAEAGDVATAVDVGSELANLDFAYREIGKLLDQWQEQLKKS
ncbi:MAG TPA: tetratricopeptide repeat protein [Gemmataceae bacterium]|nr:tetratricopeptide repeat protein [Gemmataceae bacterium]